jgi:intracellular multiplication protein IcmE
MRNVQADIGRQTVVVIACATVLTAAITYVAYTYWSGSSDKKTQIAPLQTNGRPIPSEESAHYQNVLSKYNHQNASAAQQTGDTYLSVMSTRPVNVPTAVSQATVTSAAASPVAVSPASQPVPLLPRVDSEHVKQLDDQVKALLANWVGQPHGHAQVAEDGNNYASSLRRPEHTQTPVSAPHATQSAPAEKGNDAPIVPGYELVPALLQTHIDTDEDSAVEVLVPAGTYAGARVFAPGYKRLENSVDMTFTGMSWKGHTYKINAKAVDELTLRTALSGEVNNRWFSRIMLPALAAGLGRAGQLYERSGGQTVTTPQGGVVQSEPETPSGRAVAGTVVGGIGRQAAQVMTRDAAAAPIKQVLVAAQTTIGVRFMQPVMASDELLSPEKRRGTSQTPNDNNPAPVQVERARTLRDSSQYQSEDVATQLTNKERP